MTDRRQFDWEALDLTTRQRWARAATAAEGAAAAFSELTETLYSWAEELQFRQETLRRALSDHD